MRIDELDYDLPSERIAVAPVEPRDAARLLVVDRATGSLQHRTVRELPDLGVLRAGDLLVVNQSKVVPARFAGVRAATGGRVAGLYLGHRVGPPPAWDVLLESRGKLRRGERITLAPQAPDAALQLTEARGGGQWSALLEGPHETLALLDRVGAAPIPPYIEQARRAARRPPAAAGELQRYNTVYAADPGSVAAPTAGLHFTPDLLDRIDALGVRRAAVTLHVGLGTFAPVRSTTLEGHAMHREPLHVPGPVIRQLQHTRAAGGRIVVVGTTTVRALESLPHPLPAPLAAQGFTTATDLFIRPDAGFTFRHTDVLLTNFHLPRSTLLALVAALPGVGVARLLQWYRVAVDAGYRFYSYGDAMLLA